MLGPLIELELPDDSETVPEGLKIAPVHFLSPPTDERFRNFIEGDKHEHHIVKIVQKKEGYEVEIIDSFIEIRDKFCFETEKFSNKSLCFITTVFMGFGEKPFCSHGAQIRFAVSQITAKCPHQKGALETFSWGNILQLDQILPKCLHDHNCDLSTLLSRSKRKETNTSSVQLKSSVGRLLSDTDANSGSTFIIQGNVGNVVSMGGQGQNTNRLSTSSTANTRGSMIRRGYENMTN